MSGMVCGLPPPLSVMLISPERVPRLLRLERHGDRTTGSGTERRRAGAGLGEVFPLVPLSISFVMLSPVEPVFVTWTVRGALLVPTFCAPKLSKGGESSTTVPAPFISMTCGLVEALSWIEIVPDFEPCVFGENVTLRAQLAPGATLEPQVELTPNCPFTVSEERSAHLFRCWYA
jgi:hypothetical protein